MSRLDDSKSDKRSDTISSGYSTPPTKAESSDIPAETEQHHQNLASRKTAYHQSRGPVTDALLNLFRIHGRGRDTSALDDIATQPSVFDGEHAKHYQPREDWENIEAFDPAFRWTWREEKKAIRKVDWKVLSWVCVMFFALNINRNNITPATADNFINDLGLTQADYNTGNTLSKLGFLLAELPSQLISKRLGPDRWIPIQMVIFSLLGASQFWLNGRAFFFATRYLIATFQGGFIPDIVLYLSYWYNRYDLPIRLAIFYTFNPFTVIVVSFLGAGLNQMRGVLGYAGWRWMFLIEGLFTLIISIASFWMMPVSPATTKTSFRPNGYLTDNEAKIIVNRVIRDDPAKGSMHNRQALTLKMMWKSCLDWHLLPIYIIGMLMWIPVTPVNLYLQISFRQLGFSTVMANLLAVPNGVLSMINMVVVAVFSELFDNRTFIGMAQMLWVVPCLIALVALPTVGPWQYFAILTVLLGYPYVHAIQVAWCSRNAGSVRTRTVSAAFYNMTAQLSQIIGSNIYQASDAPRYIKGNTVLLVVGIVTLILYPFTWLFYTKINRHRDRVWDAMTKEEQSHYLATTKDEGARRLDFRFAT